MGERDFVPRGALERKWPNLLQIAVWEGAEELAGRLAALTRDLGLVRGSRDPAGLVGEEFDLLVVSPDARGRPGGEVMRCRAALAPGNRPELIRALSARWLVSYGTGAANTITLSSLTAERAAVCVQRSFPALSGGAVEPQELVLPYDGTPPESYLARVGAELLLGR